jgi:hypothetical protein
VGQISPRTVQSCKLDSTPEDMHLSCPLFANYRTSFLSPSLYHSLSDTVVPLVPPTLSQGMWVLLPAATQSSIALQTLPSLNLKPKSQYPLMTKGLVTPADLALGLGLTPVPACPFAASPPPLCLSSPRRPTTSHPSTSAAHIPGNMSVSASPGHPAAGPQVG